MEFSVDKRIVEVNLKLTLEEFNTIVASIGASEYNEVKELADNYRYKIVSTKESNKLYTELKKIALENR